MIRAMRPTFRNPYDKVAFVVHASCLASGFVLLATGPSAFCDDPFSSAFAVSEDYSAIRHLELNVQDYVENGGANYESQYKNFGKLVEEINKEILSKGSPSNQPSRTLNWDKNGPVSGPVTKGTLSLMNYFAILMYSSGEGGIRDNADQSNDSYQPLGSVPSGYAVLPVPAFGGSGIFPATGAGVYPTRSRCLPYQVTLALLAPLLHFRWLFFDVTSKCAFGGSPIFPAPGPVFYPTRSIGGYEGMILGPRDAPFFPGVRRDPRLPVGSQASRPTFRNPYDKVAFAVHASCLASGFVLLATGRSAFSGDPFSLPFAGEVGIDHWNDFGDSYGFIYSTPEGPSKKVIIKCLVLNGKLLIGALWEGASAHLHLELNVLDYVENGGANYDSQYKNFGKLVEEINKEILSKGSPSTKSSRTLNWDKNGPVSGPVTKGTLPLMNYFAIPMYSSEKGGIRDNVDRCGAESNYSYQPSGSVPPGYAVLPIPAFGGSGIFPATGPGVYSTSPISPAPGPVVYPTRYSGGYEGMLLGPSYARFLTGISGDPRLPRGAQGIPPGGRFDPFGPPDVPGSEPGRFSRDPTRRRKRQEP
nr:probable proteasome inhibitor [Ipomoea batatas]